MTPKMRVTWNAEVRKWEVWEDYPVGYGGPVHHSFHRTRVSARMAARRQAKQDKADAAKTSFQIVP